MILGHKKGEITKDWRKLDKEIASQVVFFTLTVRLTTSRMIF
jgi:hypothetical protein